MACASVPRQQDQHWKLAVEPLAPIVRWHYWLAARLALLALVARIAVRIAMTKALVSLRPVAVVVACRAEGAVHEVLRLQMLH